MEKVDRSDTQQNTRTTPQHPAPPEMCVHQSFLLFILKDLISVDDVLRIVVDLDRFHLDHRLRCRHADHGML